jgi:hypothetical protein
MTEEQVKEAISRHFVQLIASRGGFLCARPDYDYGCDLTVTKVMVVPRGGKMRYLQSGISIDLQLKCTLESGIERTQTSVKYDLEAKTFNDLVYRRNSNAQTPLVLVLLVLPDNKDEWLTITPDELIVRRAAYWYMPPEGTAATPNVATTRIELPTANAVDLSFIDGRLQEAYA